MAVVFLIWLFDMAGEEEVAAVSSGFASKIKQWISWSWKYLWGIWFMMIIALVWTFRGPLRLREYINFGEEAS